MIHAQVVINHD